MTEAGGPKLGRQHTGLPRAAPPLAGALPSRPPLGFVGGREVAAARMHLTCLLSFWRWAGSGGFPTTQPRCCRDGGQPFVTSRGSMPLPAGLAERHGLRQPGGQPALLTHGRWPTAADLVLACSPCEAHSAAPFAKPPVQSPHSIYAPISSFLASPPPPVSSSFFL